MTFASSVRLFQTLVMSFHSAIVIETGEEERVRTLINKGINELQMAVFEWSVAQGLTRSPSTVQNRPFDMVQYRAK